MISKRSSPLLSAKAPFRRLGSSHCGTSRLRDFHSIEFRPVDIPVWLNASRERLLRAPRPLRLPHCFGHFVACSFSRPPALRLADYRLAPVIVLPLWFIVFIVVAVLMLVMSFNQKGSVHIVGILLLAFLYRFLYKLVEVRLESCILNRSEGLIYFGDNLFGLLS